MKDLRIIRDDPSFAGGDYSQDQDAFNHEAFANTLFNVVKDNDPPLTVGLFGGWGVGKSSIINRLEAKCRSSADVFAYVSFNAWAYSGDSLRRQLLLAIARGLIKDKPKREIELEKLRKLNYAQVLEELPGHSLKDLWDKARGEGLFKALGTEFVSAFEHVKVAEQGVVGIVVSLVFLLVGILHIVYGGITSNGEIQRWSLIWFVLMAANLFFPKVENIFVLKKREVFDARLIFPEQFEDEYNRLLEKYAFDVKKIVVVIDDLDRCDAETIKNVLVTLKNFMGRGKSMFVIPMDDSSVVRMFQGENTNFGYEQLRKYFSVSLRIPAFHDGDLLDFARRISSEYNIPPSVPWVAALGYCRDGRKMKHFLNLYKLKYGVAEERAKFGYLGGVKLENMSMQLAKIVVLEYQYPEFFRFISTYPESIELFTQAARGALSVDLNNIPMKELGDDVVSVDDLWRTQPGLRQFLRATHFIPLSDFDIVSKLKTSNQEHKLSEFGVELRNTIIAGSSLNLEKFLSDEQVKAGGQAIVDALSRYFDPDVPPAAISAARIALDVLARNSLPGENQAELFRETVSVLTHPKVGMKIAGKESGVFLENMDKLGQLQQVDLVKKIVQDVFVEDAYDPEYWRIVRHSALKKVLGLQQRLGKTIDQVAQKWYSNLKGAKEREEFVRGIDEVKFSRAERQAIGLMFPSNDLLSALSTSITPEMTEMNKLVLDCLLSENNPEEFDDEKIGLGKKLAEVFTENFEAGSYNSATAFACDGFGRMPVWLDDESAEGVGTLVIANFAKFKEDAEKERLLETLLICYCSLGDSSAKMKEFQDGYLKISDGLTTREVEKQIEIISSDSYTKTNAEKVILREILKRRLSSFMSDLESPSQETIANARLCRVHKDKINGNEYRKLPHLLLTLSDGSAVKEWEDFIIEEVQSLDEPGRASSIDQLLTTVSDPSRDSQARSAHGAVLVRLLRIFEIRFGMKYYTEMFPMLTSEDTILVEFVSSNFPVLQERFGNDVPQANVGSVAQTLLDLKNVAGYGRSITILLKFAGNIGSTTWHQLVDRLILEVPDESLDVEHRWQLLQLATGMSDAGSNSNSLSEVLYRYKEMGSVNQLKSKSWEVYDLLTRRKVIPFYSPPKEVKGDKDKE